MRRKSTQNRTNHKSRDLSGEGQVTRPTQSYEQRKKAIIMSIYLECITDYVAHLQEKIN